MKNQLQFRYPHSDKVRQLRDVRYQRVSVIQSEHCYFLGFRISTENSYRYYDAMILADDYEAFLEGVIEEFNDIQDKQAVSSPRDIAIVFVRSLVMQNPDRLRALGYHHIQPDIQKILSMRDDEQFTVFGRIGDDVWLKPVITSDALSALRVVRYKCATQMLKNFMPLEIFQAHPVKSEFDELFQEAARQVKLLIDAIPSDNGYRQ